MRHLIVRGRYLAWEDGTPFFYLADTAWELFHRLTREEIAVYFTTRAAQGFDSVTAGLDIMALVDSYRAMVQDIRG